jgi:hypothetical protein
MAQIQGRVRNHITLGKLLGSLKVTTTNNGTGGDTGSGGRPRRNKRKRTGKEKDEKLGDQQQMCTDFAATRWGSQRWLFPAALRGDSVSVATSRGGITAAAEQTQRSRGTLAAHISRGVVFELLCVAVYMNKELGVSHGDLLTNHMENVLLSDGNGQAPFTIVDFDGLSAYEEHKNDDTRVNLPDIMEHVQASIPAAKIFVAMYRTFARKTTDSWNTAMEEALHLT